ncbi:MAG: DNA topoisomerase (ATP-hydrolyzing) subunit A [Candidatus Bruticola sp.]
MSSRNSQETFSLGRVIEAPLPDLVRSRFLNYALSVITDRALPDVRDGLKPVQRRILYAMHHDLHLSPDKSTLKCAKVVGQVLGSYHPHGDSAVYEAMARMAQSWTLRYPLVFGQGNFGSIDGDGPAAYRYTEARLSPIAMEFVEELSQNTVDFVPNFDESTPEPKVLPAKVPQMLINGCMGIAVGVATNIPPHNLGEVLQACCALIDNRQLSTAQLLTHIKGPDFPTGGELLNSRQSLEQIYSSGQGALKIRGTYRVEEKNKRLFNIIIDSIPYMVNKSELVEEIGNIIMAGKIPHLQDVRDESAADIRIVLECRREADPTAVMAYLFKNTKLQSQFNVNMTCLTSRGPERVNLRTALLEFIDFRFDVTVRRLNYEVRLLNERIHILEGFVKVFEAIEEAIAIIRASSSRAQANQALCERFLIDEVQADAVLDLRLYRLSQDDVLLIRSELAEKQAKRDNLEALLGDMSALWSLVKDDFVQLSQRLADARRTQVLREGAEELVYNADDFIVDEQLEVVITRDGWLRRVPVGTDSSKLRLRLEDSIWQILEGSSLNSLVLFTNLGAAYTMAVHELPSGTRGFGEPVQKFFNFSDGEKIVAAFLFDNRSSEVWSAQDDKELPHLHALALSSDGKGVRFSFAPFVENSKKSGRRYMRLGEGAQALTVEAVRGSEHLIVLTEQNRALICPVEEISFMSGSARGVQVIKLENEDKLWESMVVSGSDQGIRLSCSGSSTLVEVSLRKQKVCARGGKGTLLIKRGKLQIQQKFYSDDAATSPAVESAAPLEKADGEVKADFEAETEV